MRKILGYMIYPSLILLGFMANKFMTNQPSKTIKREISQVKVYDETNISPMAYQFTQDLKSSTTIIKIDRFINTHYKKLESFRTLNKLNELPNDYRLMASFVYPIVNLRGSLYRIFGLVERGSGKHYNLKIVRTILNSKLQALASLINTYCPSVGNVIFDWLTSPGPGIETDLKYVHQVQDFIMTDIYVNLQKMLEIVESIKNISVNAPITIDSSVFTGQKNALPKDRRYFNIRSHELTALKQIIHSYSHGMILYAQYDRDDFINFEYAKKKKQGNPLHLFSSKVRGFSMYDRVKELKRWKSLYTFRKIGLSKPKEFSTWMLTAYDHAKKHSILEPLFLEQVTIASNALTLKQAQLSIINPKSKVLLTTRSKELFKKKSLLLLNDQSSVRNTITGEMILVNYPKFYSHPPKDLKLFLPLKDGFNLEGKKRLFNKKIINYRYGQAKAWNISYWKEYFPSVNTNSDIKAVAQTIKSSSSSSNMILNILVRFVSISSSQKILLPYSL